VVFKQGELEIGGGDMVWASLVCTPFDEEAIAQAQHHPRTNIALSLRTLHRSSLWEISKRTCSHNPWSARHVWHRCKQCNSLWDQDHNSVRNLLDLLCETPVDVKMTGTA
jgi:hypothetical protein